MLSIFYSFAGTLGEFVSPSSPSWLEMILIYFSRLSINFFVYID